VAHWLSPPLLIDRPQMSLQEGALVCHARPIPGGSQVAGEPFPRGFGLRQRHLLVTIRGESLLQICDHVDNVGS